MPKVSIKYFDCNCAMGLPLKRDTGLTVSIPSTAAEMLEEMDCNGIQRALVWHVAQRDLYPMTGNDLLAGIVAGQDRLAGCWTLLPGQCDELGDLDEFFSRARGAGVRVFRMFPNAHRYLLRSEVVGDVIERLVAGRLPLIIRPDDAGWEAIYNLMADFPKLRLILCGMSCWGSDRFFRPLLDRYAGVCVETSGYITDGGIEAFVERYGATRLLFGSNFPESYMGAMSLAVAHADISEKDKRAIAGKNLERMLNNE